MSILQLLISLAILVFIHELGHFTMARLFGVRVEKFYLFFNPAFSLFKYKSKRTGTTYGLGWVPLGGYCQLAGMIDESLNEGEVQREERPDDFRAKKAYQRLLIMAGGILFNLLLAFAIYIGVSYTWGGSMLQGKDYEAGWVFSQEAKAIGFEDGDKILALDQDSSINILDAQFLSKLLQAKVVQVERQKQKLSITIPSDFTYKLIEHESHFGHLSLPFIIDSVMPHSLAEGELQKGDEVISFNQQACKDLNQVLLALQTNKGKAISLGIRRQGQVLTIPLALDSTARLGVQLMNPRELLPISHINYNLLEASQAGLRQALNTAQAYISQLKYIFTKEGVKQMGGFGTMAKLYAPTFDWRGFWHTTAFLSIILAVMNLLPIPALDGGHIMLLLFEMITRRKINNRIMIHIQTVGVILLFTLMIYANANDIYRFFIK